MAASPAHMKAFSSSEKQSCARVHEGWRRQTNLSELCAAESQRMQRWEKSMLLSLAWLPITLAGRSWAEESLGGKQLSQQEFKISKGPNQRPNQTFPHAHLESVKNI